MDSIRITGGVPLQGKIEISGAKNAALPLMAACLLTEDTLTLHNIPHLSDITTMANLLVHHGAELTVMDSAHGEGRMLDLCAASVHDTTAPYDIVRKMRASVMVLGPLLARFGVARVSLPGGCAIGTRPIDLHLKAMAHLGAEISLQEGYVEASAPKGGLRGADFMFEKVSVGATENALLAASLAKGTSIIRNAAREPEITDLAECLVTMGSAIEGIGTDTLTVHGKKTLHGGKHRVMPDRIEAGSYAIAAAITGGDVLLTGITADILGATIAALRATGVLVTEEKEGILVRGRGRVNALHQLTTAPYPGFATDMQAQMSALLCLADGTSIITEDIFENRFMHVPELQRMGASITQSAHTIVIQGIERFHAAEVMATDLRASLSLVLAALAAEGTTTIHRVYHLDRGYERVEEKLAGLGAKIERVKG